MRFRGRLVRIIGYTGLATLSLLVVAFVAVQIQQHIFRHRAERLLADFHSIHLRETTWPEAQAIMRRWNKYGQADGPCDASSCGYLISVADSNRHLYDVLGERWYGALMHLHYYELDSLLGSRSPSMFVSLVVQDGKVVRSSASIAVAVSRWAKGSGGYSYDLIADSKSRSNLSTRSQDFQNDGWVLGNDEQLDDHPDYKVGRPGGCENCEEALVTFTPFLDHAEVNRLTNFNLDCVTRFHPCTAIEDLLPAIAPYHLYQDAVMEPVTGPCRTSPRAIGRDADVVIEVLAGESRNVVYPADAYWPARTEEAATVRILNILKGQSHVHVSEALDVIPFSEDGSGSTAPSTAHFVKGHRYLLRVAKDKLVPEADRSHPIGLDRCGILDDTPSNLAEMQIGFAQGKKLRRPQGVNVSIYH